MPLAATLAQLANASGYRPDDPLVIAVGRSGRRPAYLARGCLPAGLGAMSPRTLVYAASLAKQVTAACAAILGLDIETPVSQLVPSLPPSAGPVRLRHLIHHTGESPPGTRFAYSNPGYILLAEAIGRAGGEPVPQLARRLIFEPLGMRDTLFWSGPAPHPPGAVPMSAPLSIGDGGLWSTADDLLRWAAALDQDRLGITARVQTPGCLDDGTPLDYAWGMGVRTHGELTVYRHGGGYAELRAMLVRVPDKGLDLVVLALGDRTERRVDLTDRLLDVLLA
jgi:CubicO group peptidase (beta-lactamase class C family)